MRRIHLAQRLAVLALPLLLLGTATAQAQDKIYGIADAVRIRAERMAKRPGVSKWNNVGWYLGTCSDAEYDAAQAPYKICVQKTPDEMNKRCFIRYQSDLFACGARAAGPY